MIMLTRLSGSRFVLNSDLIERVDATPDTVITLTDGTKYVVAESLLDVVAAVRDFRSEIVALSTYVPVDPHDLFTPHDPDQGLEPGHLAPVSALPLASVPAGQGVGHGVGHGESRDA